jgi:hypothetical protein
VANFLKYRDFISKIEFSSEDQIFYGKVEMINDTVLFEAENSKELQSSFEEAVDDYIQSRYAVIDIERNKELRALELEKAYRDIQTEIKSGKAQTLTAEQHLADLRNE